MPTSAAYGFNRPGRRGGKEFGAHTDLMPILDGGRRQRYWVDAGEVPPRMDFRLYFFRDRAVLAWDWREKALVAAT